VQDVEHQQDRSTRSLKGILKNLKEQPRLPDSVELESKEDTNSNIGPSYSLDISGKGEIDYCACVGCPKIVFQIPNIFQADK